MWANNTRRSQTAATALQMSVAALVRARTVGFPAEKPGQHDPQRRAVDCASYLALRFCVFALKMRTHEAMRAYHKRR